MPLPTEAEIRHGVPLFLDQLVDTLRLGLTSTPEIQRSAAQHGQELLLRGFTVSQVVQDYGDVCQSITTLAVEIDSPIGTDDFRTLNRCLDEAIAGAVTQYGLVRDRAILDGESARGTERLGFLAHEVGLLANTAMLAFDVLKTGNVGMAGTTGAVLHHSLASICALISRSLAEVRLAQRIQKREPFLVSGFLAQLAPSATLLANTKGLTLRVMPVEDGVMVEADRQILAAVVGSLLQNAFEFTAPRTTVTLDVAASAERVLIEVRDECGGLPDGDVNDLFRPFQPRGADGTGLGLGLAFSRWGVEANDCRVYVRNVPGKGCVFTVDLPRFPMFAGGTFSVAEASIM